MENKRVKITNCEGKLQFVKAIKEVTGKSLLECKNIADVLVIPNGLSGYKYGTLLLNESSITLEQWDEIAKLCDIEIKFEYVQTQIQSKCSGIIRW